MGNNCDCKHAEYCKLNPANCTLEEKFKHFNQNTIFNKTTKEISEMQGRKGLVLKK